MRNALILNVFITLLACGVLLAQDHENVEQVSRIYNQWDKASEIIVVDDYAYIAAGLSGLQIVVLTGDDSLEIIGFWDGNQWEARAVAIDGGIAYLVDEVSGLHIIDISDQRAPVETGRYMPRYVARDVEVWQDMACVKHSVTDTSCYQILDVSDPAHPAEVVEFIHPGYCYDMEIKSELLYIASDSLFIYDMRDLDNIQRIGQLGWEDDRDRISGFAIEDSLLYATTSVRGMRFVIIDISDPTAPQVTGSANLPVATGEVVVRGDYAYVANGRTGLVIMDVSSPEQPEQVGTLSVDNNSLNVGLLEDYVLLTAYDLNFPYKYGAAYLIDVSDVAAPTEADCIKAEGYALNVSVAGDMAFVANENGGMGIIDISDITTPVEVGVVPTEYQVWAATGRENLVYISESDGGLRIVDISDFPDIEDVGRYQYDDRSYIIGVTLQDNIAFLTDTRRLIILDISDPAQPAQLAEIDFFGTRNIAVAGEFIYVVGNHMFAVFSISDLNNPQPISSLDLPENAVPEIIDVQQGLAFIAAGEEGLLVYDVSGDQPELISIFDTPGYARGLDVQGDIVYIGDRSEGLRVLDVSDIHNIQETGHYNTPGLARGLCSDGNIIFVADASNLGIYRFDNPDAIDISRIETQPFTTRLLVAYPNPFNSSTTLTYVVPARSSVSLKVYNARGQLVDVLLDEMMAAGRHSTVWEGQDVAAGVYWVRLTAPRKKADVGMQMILIK